MTDSTPETSPALAILQPDQPLAPGLRVCTTLRAGGVSQPPYQSLNLGLHSGDSSDAVRRNRAILSNALQLPASPLWLRQTHGSCVCTSATADASQSFDASWSDQPGRVLAVLTADCLPVVLCSSDGEQFAVAHAGWRGLAAGVLQNTVRHFSAPPDSVRAWLGPAIGPQQFEVGPEVRECFMAALGDTEAVRAAFCRAEALGRAAGKWYADLYQLARIALAEVAVTTVHGGGLCTYSDARHYFSYRRDGRHSGRMATLVWRD